MQTLETMKFSKKDFCLPIGPDEAEGTIGGSCLSDLIGDGPFFDLDKLPDDYDYDFIYYYSRRCFDASSGEEIEQLAELDFRSQYLSGNYNMPMEIIAVYKENQPEQRTFYLNYHANWIDLEINDGEIEEWKEIKLVVEE